MIIMLLFRLTPKCLFHSLAACLFEDRYIQLLGRRRRRKTVMAPLKNERRREREREREWGVVEPNEMSYRSSLAIMATGKSAWCAILWVSCSKQHQIRDQFLWKLNCIALFDLLKLLGNRENVFDCWYHCREYMQFTFYSDWTGKGHFNLNMRWKVEGGGGL